MKIVETTKTSRLYTHIVESPKWAIVSPYRSEYSEEENQQRMSKLKADVRNLGYGFIQFVSRWVENGEAFDEESLLIPKMDRDEAISLGKKYNQSSVIVCSNNKAQEICTNPFENHKSGDEVRTFNLSGDKPLNLNDAEEIFARRKGGPVSKTKYGKAKPFTLKEVYEKYDARPSYFQTKPTMIKIFENNEGIRMRESYDSEIREKIAELADYLGIEKTDIDRTQYGSFEIISGDNEGEEYYVYTEDERESAMRDNFDGLWDDLGMESFSDNFKEWIFENCLDEDAIDDALAEERDYFESEDDTDNVEIIDSIIEGDLSDKIGYFEDMFGKGKEFNDWLVDNNFIDKDQVYDAMIEYDENSGYNSYGIALASYDGEEGETDNYFVYRIN